MTQAQKTENKAKEQCDPELWREAAVLWRAEGYEDKAEYCEMKADELEQ